MATEGLHSAAVKFSKVCGGKSCAGRGLRRPPKAASLEPQGRDVRCSIRSRRSFMGSGPHVTPELEISNRSSRADWGRHDATSTSRHGMMCKNATHSRRMMEAAVQSGSAGISGPLGSVPPGKKGRADSLLNPSAIVARRSFQALPPSGLSSVGKWIENMSRAAVISLKLRKTLMCATGGRAAQSRRRCLQREAAVSGSVVGWRIAARRRAAGRRRRRARRYP
jgi:hypothetical protein